MPVRLSPPPVRRPPVRRPSSHHHLRNTSEIMEADAIATATTPTKDVLTAADSIDFSSMVPPCPSDEVVSNEKNVVSVAADAISKFPETEITEPTNSIIREETGKARSRSGTATKHSRAVSRSSRRRFKSANVDRSISSGSADAVTPGRSANFEPLAIVTVPSELPSDIGVNVGDSTAGEDSDLASPFGGSDATVESPLARKSHLFKTLSGKFGCDKCDKEFPRFSELNYHRSLFHTECHLYACRLCDKKYYYRRQLRTHVEEYHEMAGNDDESAVDTSVETDSILSQAPPSFHAKSEKKLIVRPKPPKRRRASAIPKSPRSQRRKASFPSPPILVADGGRELRRNSERERLRCESRLIGFDSKRSELSTVTAMSSRKTNETSVSSKRKQRASLRETTSATTSHAAEKTRASSDASRLREVKSNSVKRGEQFRIYLSLRRIAIRSRRSRNIVGTYCRRCPGCQDSISLSRLIANESTQEEGVIFDGADVVPIAPFQRSTTRSASCINQSSAQVGVSNGRLASKSETVAKDASATIKRCKRSKRMEKTLKKLRQKRQITSSVTSSSSGLNGRFWETEGTRPGLPSKRVNAIEREHERRHIEGKKSPLTKKTSFKVKKNENKLSMLASPRRDAGLDGSFWYIAPKRRRVETNIPTEDFDNRFGSSSVSNSSALALSSPTVGNLSNSLSKVTSPTDENSSKSASLRGRRRSFPLPNVRINATQIKVEKSTNVRSNKCTRSSSLPSSPSRSLGLNGAKWQPLSERRVPKLEIVTSHCKRTPTKDTPSKVTTEGKRALSSPAKSDVGKSVRRRSTSTHSSPKTTGLNGKFWDTISDRSPGKERSHSVSPKLRKNSRASGLEAKKDSRSQSLPSSPRTPTGLDGKFWALSESRGRSLAKKKLNLDVDSSGNFETIDANDRVSASACGTSMDLSKSTHAQPVSYRLKTEKTRMEDATVVASGNEDLEWYVDDDDVLYSLSEQHHANADRLEPQSVEDKDTRRSKSCRTVYGPFNRAAWCQPCCQKKKCIMLQRNDYVPAPMAAGNESSMNGSSLDEVDDGADVVRYRLTPKALKAMRSSNAELELSGRVPEASRPRSFAPSSVSPVVEKAKKRKSVVVVFVEDPPYIVAPGDVKEDLTVDDVFPSYSTPRLDCQLASNSMEKEIKFVPKTVERPSRQRSVRLDSRPSGSPCKVSWPKQRSKWCEGCKKKKDSCLFVWN